MESQRKHRAPPAQPLATARLLRYYFLLAALLVTSGPAVDSLLCNFCPLQPKHKSCSNITSECLPQDRCSTSRGRYGSVHVLSAQGCVAPHLCGTFQPVTYQGVTYNVSYTCCCRDGCNQPPSPDTHLKRLLGLTVWPSMTPPTTPDPRDACPTTEAATS